MSWIRKGVKIKETSHIRVEPPRIAKRSTNTIPKHLQNFKGKSGFHDIGDATEYATNLFLSGAWPRTTVFKIVQTITIKEAPDERRFSMRDD